MRKRQSRWHRGWLFARDATGILVVVVGLSLLPGPRFGDAGSWGDLTHWIGRIVQWTIGLVIVGIVALARFPELQAHLRRRRVRA
ncbi:MAG: hypothetical protein V4737_09540 [Curtobacterium sp.]